MTNLLFVSIPGFLIYSLLSLAPFARLADPKTRRLLHCFHAALTVAVAALYYLAAVLSYASPAFVKGSALLFAVLVAVVHSLALRGLAQAHILSCSLAALCSHLLTSLSALIALRLFPWDSIRLCICAEAISGLSAAILYVPLRRLIVNTVRPFLSIRSGSPGHSTWLIPLLLLLACYLSLPGNDPAVSLPQIISRFLIAIAVFFVCRTMADDLTRLQEKQAMAEQLAQQKFYNAEMSQEIEKARRQRHDLKHHLTTLQHYLETDNKEALQEYCREMLAQSEIQGSLPYSGNSAADGVIYHYMRLSAERQIRFTFQGTICGNGIADTDLCVLLGNALDNALNGCMTLAENRFICVTAQSEKRLLSILIQNSFDGIVTQHEAGLLSRKRENRRGIGLSSMNAVCQSYGGTMTHSWDQKTFTVCILLPLRNL